MNKKNQIEDKDSYNLNDNSLHFINNLAGKLVNGSVYTTTELIELFQQSSYYNEIVKNYYKSALTKSISYAVTRSPHWTRVKRGINEKRFNSEMKSDNISSEKTRKSKVTMSTSRTVNIDLKGSPISLVTNSRYREKLIEFLASNIFDVIMLKKNIKDDGLRHYHFTKGIGEELYFLTESFYKKYKLKSSKHCISDFITERARDIILSRDTRNNLIFEHMVPKNFYLSYISSEALTGTLTEERVYELFKKYLYVCTVAKRGENDKLPGTSMGDNWDQRNPFHRYECAGIKFYPNIFNQLYFK